MELKVKILGLLLVVLLVFNVANTNAAKALQTTTFTSNNFANTCQLGGDGSIVIINDDRINFLEVTTDDGSTVTSVSIYNAAGTIVASFDGCGSQQCKYNISGLGKGTYKVVAGTTAGGFEGSITL